MKVFNNNNLNKKKKKIKKKNNIKYIICIILQIYHFDQTNNPEICFDTYSKSENSVKRINL